MDLASQEKLLFHVLYLEKKEASSILIGLMNLKAGLNIMKIRIKHIAFVVSYLGTGAGRRKMSTRTILIYSRLLVNIF
jgi:hypothetical protein